MIKVYNPIYDSVFKYLMEDERVSKIILGSILNKKIESIEVKNNAHVITLKNGVKVLRIDFGATICEADKEPEVVTIELQKAVAQGEILRFRQYLGLQYQSESNCPKEKKEKGGKEIETEVPRHIYAIYILGHTIGDNLKYAIIKDKHVFSDNEGNVIEIPQTNKYINGLTHDTIIVQVPYLKRKRETQLDKILSIFDQTQAIEDKFIVLDDNMDSSPEYQEIMKALIKATADTKVQGDINFEDEMEREFAVRDQAIVDLKAEVDEQKCKIDEQKNQIDEQKSQIDEQKKQLTTTIQMLKNLGIASSEIAKQLNISENKVNGI